MEDPPGFQRVEEPGKRPFYYRLPVFGKLLRKKFTTAVQVEDYLKEEKALGHLSEEITISSFDFKKRKRSTENDGIKKTKTSNEEINCSEQVLVPEIKSQPNSLFKTDNLLEGEKKLDYKFELQVAAAELDSFRRKTSYTTNTSREALLEQVKVDVMKGKCIEDMVEILSTYDDALWKMTNVIQEHTLQEMLALSELEGPLPLSEFPNNMTQNWFSEVVKFAIKHSPITTAHLANLLMKEKENNIEPSHVINFATIFAHLSKCVTKSNNAHHKMTTLQLKMSGLTDEGINAMAKQNICVTSECLRMHRDHFAEVANEISVENTKDKLASQYTIDNCDVKCGRNHEHLTVEFIESELVDTSHLCNQPMAPHETRKLFKPNLLLLGSKENSAEKDHLGYVIAVAVGREIGKLRPLQASSLSTHLPQHHRHKNSHIECNPAKIKLVPPHYYMETNNSEMISLAEDLQKEKLSFLAKQRPNDLKFHSDLAHIYEIVPGNEPTEDKNRRELAEYRVEKVVRESGEFIGHGDLLTVKMFQRAVLLRSGSVRAVDRLFYLGAFRLQLFHLVMNKTALDIQSGMPKDKNRMDEGSLGHVAGALGVTGWFTNNKKKIVRGGYYEKHSQVLRAYQLGLLANLFDNYIKCYPDAMSLVKDTNTAIDFVHSMLTKYGIQYFWDSEFVDPMENLRCDLLKSSRDQMIRLALDLGFRQCEKENDAVGLRALRRSMCLYFLNKSPEQTSNYAKFLLTDLVVEASASERSQQRMDLLVTINPSGTRGGGLYRDMYNEIMVKLVKVAIKKQHSALNHIQLETLVESISVMKNLNDHNLKSCLFEQSGKSSSHDLIGEENQQLIEELVREQDPFDINKNDVSVWSHKTRGSPFQGLTYENIARFIVRVQEQFMLQFPILG